MKFNLLIPALISLFLSCSHAGDRVQDKYRIVDEIANDKESPFYIDFARYPTRRAPLPVGVFDSGTGGLTVLEAILRYDAHDNCTHTAGADGIPDFATEHFEYLADDANMPYGRYDAEGKADFLRELIIKDVRFLLGNTYYLRPEDSVPQHDKAPVKTIVIACNTATAFGLATVREAIRVWGVGVKVLGIVEAGAREAVRRMGDDENGVIGILATEGTCASQGYPRAVAQAAQSSGHRGTVTVIQQAGIGLAGAIDGDRNYLDPQATAPRDTDHYRGPRPGDARYPLDTSLLQAYHFDTTGHALLTARDAQGRLTEIQLNSVDNYIRYMVTEMAAKMVRQHPDKVLRQVILGCTHYPYHTDAIRDHFLYLRSLDSSYARVIAPDIAFIDPAESLAGELYDHLTEKKLWDPSPAGKKDRFFISVPNPLLPENEIDSMGRFPYAYKYGREMNSSLQYVKIVPFSERWITPGVRKRLEEDLPRTWERIEWWK